MALRVIAGTAGGRRLVAPAGGGARPTTDRLKEALFASLGPARLADAVVLDLYAGSGALAIEALSRGAASAVLVDDDRAAVEAIRANLATTSFTEQAAVVEVPVDAFLGRDPSPGPFDLVLLDPPYALPSGDVSTVLAALAAPGWLADGATIVVERPKGKEPVTLPPGWQIEKERPYGDTLLLVATT